MLAVFAAGMMRWEADDQRAWVLCSSENWGLEETRCAKCIVTCVSRGYSTIEDAKCILVCLVASVIVLCRCKYWQ